MSTLNRNARENESCSCLSTLQIQASVSSFFLPVESDGTFTSWSSSSSVSHPFGHLHRVSLPPKHSLALFGAQLRLKCRLATRVDLLQLGKALPHLDREAGGDVGAHSRRLEQPQRQDGDIADIGPRLHVLRRVGHAAVDSQLRQLAPAVRLHCVEDRFHLEAHGLARGTRDVLAHGVVEDSGWWRMVLEYSGFGGGPGRGLTHGHRRSI